MNDSRGEFSQIKLFEARAHEQAERGRIEDQREAEMKLWISLTKEQRIEVQDWVKKERAHIKQFKSIFDLLCLNRARVMFGQGGKDG